MDNSIIGALNASSVALEAFAQGTHVIAHNIANVSTPNFTALRADYVAAGNQAVTAQIVPERGQAIYESREAAPGVDLATEFVRLIATQHSFEANTKVIGAVDGMLGSLLNIKS